MNARFFDRLPVGLIVAFTALASAVVAQNTPPAPVPKAAASGTETAAAAETEAGLPPLTPEALQQYSLDHYEKIREKSPFSFKIVKQEGPPPESFAKDLALAGFTIDSGKGVTFASLVDKKQNTRFVINSNAPNKDGIQLVKLNRGPTLLETTVLARKGVEEATIAADKQIIERKAVGAAPGAAARPATVPGQPGNAPARNNIQGQINQQLRPQSPNGQQPPGNPPSVNDANAGGNAGGAAQPPVVAAQATAANGAPMSAGDQAAAAAGILPQNNAAPPGAQPNNQPNNQGGGQRPARRRVILPPPVGK